MNILDSVKLHSGKKSLTLSQACWLCQSPLEDKNKTFCLVWDSWGDLGLDPWCGFPPQPLCSYIPWHTHTSLLLPVWKGINLFRIIVYSTEFRLKHDILNLVFCLFHQSGPDKHYELTDPSVLMARCPNKEQSVGRYCCHFHCSWSSSK